MSHIILWALPGLYCAFDHDMVTSWAEALEAGKPKRKKAPDNFPMMLKLTKPFDQMRLIFDSRFIYELDADVVNPYKLVVKGLYYPFPGNLPEGIIVEDPLLKMGKNSMYWEKSMPLLIVWDMLLPSFDTELPRGLEVTFWKLLHPRH
jgi:hypothetical protein